MRTLAFAVFAIAAGCGGGSDVPFVGTWLVTNTDGTNDCPPVPSDITGTQDEFTLSISDGELVRDTCNLRLTVSGNRASHRTSRHRGLDNCGLLSQVRSIEMQCERMTHS